MVVWLGAPVNMQGVACIQMLPLQSWSGPCCSKTDPIVLATSLAK